MAADTYKYRDHVRHPTTHKLSYPAADNVGSYSEMAPRSLALLAALLVVAAAAGQVRGGMPAPVGVSPLVGYEIIYGRVPCRNGSFIDGNAGPPFPSTDLLYIY